MTVEEANELALQAAEMLELATTLLEKFRLNCPDGWMDLEEANEAGTRLAKAITAIENEFYE